MKPENTRLILVGLLAATLAGCGGRNDAATQPAPQSMTVQRQEDAFGTGFGVAFRVDANGVPIVPQDSDVNPVDPTKEPVALK